MYVMRLGGPLSSQLCSPPEQDGRCLSAGGVVAVAAGGRGFKTRLAWEMEVEQETSTAILSLTENALT